MRPQKRKLQLRQSRAGRMRSAAVKQALATNTELVKPGVAYRRGVHQVEPTPATDALLFDQTAESLRRAAGEVAWLVVGMALVALVVTYLARPPEQPLGPAPGMLGLTPGMVNFLVVLAALTGVLGLLIVLRRWHQGRTAARRLSKDERRCALAAGTLHVQERETEIGSRAHWLRPLGDDWLPVERPVFEALEPLMVEKVRDDASVDQQSGGDVIQAWTVANATILFHRQTQTIIEIHDLQGDVVYRHPCYRPRV
jgi:hypothetical protein